MGGLAGSLEIGWRSDDEPADVGGKTLGDHVLWHGSAVPDTRVKAAFGHVYHPVVHRKLDLDIWITVKERGHHRAHEKFSSLGRHAQSHAAHGGVAETIEHIDGTADLIERSNERGLKGLAGGRERNATTSCDSKGGRPGAPRARAAHALMAEALMSSSSAARRKFRRFAISRKYERSARSDRRSCMFSRSLFPQLGGRLAMRIGAQRLSPSALNAIPNQREAHSGHPLRSCCTVEVAQGITRGNLSFSRSFPLRVLLGCPFERLPRAGARRTLGEGIDRLCARTAAGGARTLG